MKRVKLVKVTIANETYLPGKKVGDRIAVTKLFFRNGEDWLLSADGKSYPAIFFE